MSRHGEPIRNRAYNILIPLALRTFHQIKIGFDKSTCKQVIRCGIGIKDSGINRDIATVNIIQDGDNMPNTPKISTNDPRLSTAKPAKVEDSIGTTHGGQPTTALHGGVGQKKGDPTES